jgi:hypothetical protein
MNTHRSLKGLGCMLLGTGVLSGMVSLTSCALEFSDHEAMMEGVAPGTEVYVNEDPPPPREEVIVGVAPGPSYVWVGGYWAWHSSNWYWVRGRWTARPQPHAIWEAGRWEHRGRGHIWVGGYWR